MILHLRRKVFNLQSSTCLRDFTISLILIIMKYIIIITIFREVSLNSFLDNIFVYSFAYCKFITYLNSYNINH